MDKQRLQELAGVKIENHINDIWFLFELKQEELRSQIPNLSPKLKPYGVKLIAEHASKLRQFTLDKVLLEYTNPDNGYEINLKINKPTQKVWNVNRENDGEFLMILNSISEGVYEFSFVFNKSKSFDKNENEVIGKEYLSTVDKCLRDNVFPFMNQQPIGTEFYFNCHNNDGGGKVRKRVFLFLLNKYINDNFEVDVDEFDITVTKIN